ncbi:MAG: hypothetical protein Q9192_007861, partial [Flavoplaca navasiana]
VTRFLDEHLRARIGTRLIAEQHIALHLSSQPHNHTYNHSSNHGSSSPFQTTDPSSCIGVIDTALHPAHTINHCTSTVSEICELKYGVRPTLIINGQTDATITHVPTHLEYIITELLKNAFRATVESGKEREPIEVTIAASPADEASSVSTTEPNDSSAASGSPSIPGVTIRIRDRGGGIAPDVLPNIWAYSFTTFADEDVTNIANNTSGTGGNGNGNIDALNAISGAGGDSSSLAGLGYGLPLGRAYAEHFGGGIQVQSLWGWGTDVYLKLKSQPDTPDRSQTGQEEASSSGFLKRERTVYKYQPNFSVGLFVSSPSTLTISYNTQNILPPHCLSLHADKCIPFTHPLRAPYHHGSRSYPSDRLLPIHCHMSGIPILGPLTSPFGEFLHPRTAAPFAFTTHKATKMERTGREMRGAAPLWEIEPRPMGQDSFPAILERGKEASEAKEAKVGSSEVEAPVTEVQEMSAERKKSHAPIKVFCNMCKRAWEGNLFWSAVDPAPCKSRHHPSDVPHPARRRSSLAKMNTLERFREEQAKLERAGSNDSSASQSRARRFSRLGLRPKAPPLSKTLDTVIREEAQHGHGVEHASRTYNQYVEHQRSCHNSRRNSAEDLAVVEEGPEQQQQPEEKKVKKARSMGNVGAAASAGGKGGKKVERKLGETEVESALEDDVDSGYDSKRGSHSLKEQASK